MKKDLQIAMSLFSFFIQHLGKPHQLFYCMRLYECIDFGTEPGHYHAGIVKKQHLR